MISFEELLPVDDTILQSLLESIPVNEIAYALKGASPDMQKKIIQNMSRNAGIECTHALHTLGAVPVETVERAQCNILSRYACKRNAEQSV